MKIGLYIAIGLAVVFGGVAIYYYMCEQKSKLAIADLKKENEKLKATIKPATAPAGTVLTNPTATAGTAAANALANSLTPKN